MSKFSKFVGNQNSGPPRIKEHIPVRVLEEHKATGVKATDLDPRPDLVEDHQHWVAVLSLAWYRDRDLWSLLHGLRCGGARLELRRNRDGKEFFRLDYTSLLQDWDEDELRSRWLMPHRDAMRNAFHQAPAMMRSVDAEMAQSGRRQTA